MSQELLHPSRTARRKIQSIGQASWRAENGEIVGTPKAASGGWLLAERSYEDVAVFASFKCAGCQTGVLMRAERTADGGVKGVFVSLNEGDLAAYRVTIDRRQAVLVSPRHVHRSRPARATGAVCLPHREEPEGPRWS